MLGELVDARSLSGRQGGEHRRLRQARAVGGAAVLHVGGFDSVAWRWLQAALTRTGAATAEIPIGNILFVASDNGGVETNAL